MDYILNIETTTTNCSVSIAADGVVVHLLEDNNINYSHAESLHVFIDEALQAAQLRPQQLSAVAVSMGPGSYTGLRIGVSAAKGLCYALDIPLIAVQTLEALAHQVQIEEGYIVPMLDARRMEVYAAVYDAAHHQVREIQAQIMEADSFNAYLQNAQVYFIGSGVGKTKELINSPHAVFVEDKLPSAREMAPLSHDLFVQGKVEDVAYFEPFYLKDFIGTKPKD